MNERPIKFIAEMVRAVLDGRKTQTRWPVPKWQMPKETEGPHDEFPNHRWMSVAHRHRRWGFGVFGATEDECMNNYNTEYGCLCPLGKKGDRLWVRETLSKEKWPDYHYEAYPQVTAGTGDEDFNYRGSNYRGLVPAIHMPRWASRILLEITDIRVERVQDISEADAAAEGIFPYKGGYTTGAMGPFSSPILAFSDLWESTGGDWHNNPWVWVIDFKVVEIKR